MPSSDPSVLLPPIVDVPVEPMSTSAPAPLAAPARRPFVFAATGSAYFRIWIVNVLLTIVTVGIYSPWAKVRRLRYFYGNTLLDGSSFEFHGRPIALLKGRLIGLVLFVAYSQSAKVSVTVWVVVALSLLALMPWLLWKSLRFRLFNSSYRGIRFGFDGTIGDAYLTFVPLLLMVVGPAFIVLLAQAAAGSRPDLALMRWYFVALGVALLLGPWFYFRWRAYQHRHARAGDMPFAFDGRARTVYLIALKSVLFGLLFSIVAAIAAAVVGGLFWLVPRVVAPRFANAAGIGAAVATFYLVIISSWAFTKAMMQNFIWNHSSLGGHRFACRVGRSTLWRIELVNLVLTLATLGFFWPFAIVRSMRYRIGALSWDGDSGALKAAMGDAQVGATGEETAELFGLDIAL